MTLSVAGQFQFWNKTSFFKILEERVPCHLGKWLSLETATERACGAWRWRGDIENSSHIFWRWLGVGNFRHLALPGLTSWQTHWDTHSVWHWDTLSTHLKGPCYVLSSVLACWDSRVHLPSFSASAQACASACFFDHAVGRLRSSGQSDTQDPTFPSSSAFPSPRAPLPRHSRTLYSGWGANAGWGPGPQSDCIRRVRPIFSCHPYCAFLPPTSVL